MKIAFQTLACPLWDWDTIVSEAHRLGYDGIEIRGIEGEMYLPKARPFLPQNIERTKVQLKELGLEICCLDTGCSFHDNEQFDKAITEGQETILLAEKLGVPYIRVFGDKIPDQAKQADTIRQVARGLEQLGQYAEGKGVTVLLETHGDFNNQEIVSEVFRLTQSAAIGLLWDFEHPFMHGEQPEVTYKNLSSWIRHTHVKDAIREGGEKRLTLIGDGEVPVPQIVRLLKEGGYTGWLSLEYEKKWVPTLDEPETSLPAYIQYIKKVLAE
ncbi:sugar phosphate isomerase/epimerase family protein [Paenibacillus thalictri]|uniref:Sugar phosphate isomerase/epimerase n=1 Tax=Paenibacillus thalictri TaxID=2527873 RepID=A0A4Q9DYP5_9BACL|nr:sugar phosphate isomerase/epimerase family protein [Paenibacillus thalictri]TBL81526.1 sugar phosphate isomerase/epimerase [Paenibacillus thalictri]